MGEDECDIFSVKLEDIHLARHSSVTLNNHPPTNQFYAGFVQKKNDSTNQIADPDSTQYGLSNYWQQVFDDAQPVIPQDIILPNLISEESVDFGRDFNFFRPSSRDDSENAELNGQTAEISSGGIFNVTQDGQATIPNAVCESPVPFNRSRPASPNPKEENGSEKKRIKFERSGSGEMLPPSNGLIFFEGQNTVCNDDVLNRKNAQSIYIPVTYNDNLSGQTSLVNDLSAGRYVTIQNHSQQQHVQNLSVSPVLPSNYTERRISNQSLSNILHGQSGGNIILAPDSTDQLIVSAAPMRPQSERSYCHSRSVSTSPEPRDDGLVDMKDKNRDKGTKEKIPRHKRPSHINAEQRRRSKIQNGIEDLNQLLPPIPGDTRSNVGTSKKSNAALLGRAAGYCRQIKAECREKERESESLRSQIESLTAQINAYHTLLPADGVNQTNVPNSVSIEQRFYDYVRSRIQGNWKFYIFGLLIRPFFETYNRTVSTTSMADFLSTVSRWTQEQFTLGAFRLNTTPVFRHISKKTSFMITPENLPQEALELSATIGRSHIDSSGNTVQNVDQAQETATPSPSKAVSSIDATSSGENLFIRRKSSTTFNGNYSDR